MEEVRSEQFLRIYAETRTIAVVGASADASKAAHQVPRYLQNQGYRILPVNPRGANFSESGCSARWERSMSPWT